MEWVFQNLTFQKDFEKARSKGSIKKEKKKIILSFIHSDHLSRSSFEDLPTTAFLELNQWRPQTSIMYHIFTHSAALQ